MTSKVSFILNKIHDVDEVNSLLVSAFVDINKLRIEDGSWLSRYIILASTDDHLYSRLVTFENAVVNTYNFFSFELLIDFFEFVVSPSDKVVTGAIYTPQYIRKAIVDNVFHQLEERNYAALRVADIACGCGGFFLTVCEKILSETDLDCHYIFEHILYGCDIEEYCIERSKILLTLKALERGERTDDLVFNLHQGNSLIFDWGAIIPGFTGFDAIVGNPPYVTSAKMSDETRALLNNWKVCSSGKADLYIPFFQIAIELLNDDGILGYITVSNFYRSLNGKALREYFAEHKLNLTIVDFGGDQVFKGCSTYTCLFFADRKKEGIVRYVKTKSSILQDVRSIHFIEATYDDLDSTKGWIIKDRTIDEILRQIEDVGTSLDKVIAISNGIATLKNEIYVLNVVDETEQVLIHEFDGVRYPIEREICRPVIKPSAMDVNTPIEEQMGWIIYPYRVQGRRAICFDEKLMLEHYPNAYNYLKDVRDILAKRDKGKRKYEQWYSYGRSQAINMPGFRLFMPYIADKPSFILSKIDGLLYYNGFALVSDSIQQLERLNKILNTDIFWFYVENISKPYANGYYSMGKRYIRYFGIPNFTEEQLLVMDNETDREKIEQLLYLCYFGDKADKVKAILKRNNVYS